MRITNALVLFVVGLVFIFSCKKNETTPAKTKTELLASTISKTWKNTKIQVTNEQGLSADVTAFQQPCLTDNVVIFFPNKTYEFREGATKCNATDPDLIIKANWAFNADETKFTIDRISFLGENLSNVTFDIVSLSEQTFVSKTNYAVKGVAALPDGNYLITATFEPTN